MLLLRVSKLSLEVTELLLLLPDPFVILVGLGLVVPSPFLGACKLVAHGHDLPASIFIPDKEGSDWKLNPKAKLFVALPVIAALVVVLVYFKLFDDPVIIVVIFVLYVAVSLWNRKKFGKQAPQS